MANREQLIDNFKRNILAIDSGIEIAKEYPKTKFYCIELKGGINSLKAVRSKFINSNTINFDLHKNSLILYLLNSLFDDYDWLSSNVEPEKEKETTIEREIEKVGDDKKIEDKKEMTPDEFHDYIENGGNAHDYKYNTIIKKYICE